MTLALIAGTGQMPKVVAEAQEIPPLVCMLEGNAPDGLVPDVTFRLETLGSLLVDLGTRGVTDVCFVGGIARPELDPGALDAETAPLVPLFQQALKQGDDGALRIVLDIFEKTGFAVRGVEDLVPALLAEGGVYSQAWPDAQMRRDAEVGAEHIALEGARDIGQACVVAGGRVIGMEDAAGTDALIARMADRSNDARAILFKAPKPGQERRIDLPTIGPDTVEAAAKAGFAGIVIDAGDVLVLNRAQCVELADRHGLVLWARTGD
ncbi:LpxI family protein [Pseudosulfitobacter koreensis]|uniref:UDP-2,3-diacylglucosamine diphosphatase LpxI n=1 Tax=Pseudosulfitobacter koreensis TaxID=2968472 RepID=A0ABT1Z2D5_9RHOB|nr:UDP-2,3-diacylglucosamine diphosphatase LpxI [Pseudosulfitobacter koreense]MCR8827287.1 UDP-2,3-diacylglucosamine diphosphatase LpxI [Pseudosulfitobacter koreense]